MEILQTSKNKLPHLQLTAVIDAPIEKANIVQKFLLLFRPWILNSIFFIKPNFQPQRTNKSIFDRRLLFVVLLGIIMMFILVIGNQDFLQFSKMDEPIMFELRAILINLSVYIFLVWMFGKYQSQQLKMELERTQAMSLGAQYELLKQQVNPHFLFNSLSTLKAMVEMQDPQSADFIIRLSDFYRFTLESRKLDLIPVKEELHILDSYIYMLKVHFEEGFDLVNEVDRKQYDLPIPPFTLQLLLENCIKHNVVSLDKPLRIRLYSENDFLIIENPIQVKKGVFSTGVGLENINKRFMHLIHKELEISVAKNVFKVKIPIK